MEILKERPQITTLIKKVSQEQGITNHIITDVKTNQKGEGYLGEIFLVAVKDKKSGEKLDIVIKAAFSDEKLREMAKVRLAFQNEINFYMNVFPIFEKFEKERGVSSKVELVPKCLKVSIKEQEEMLVLENLKVSGFEIFDKTCVLDHDHVALIFKNYGRFHAYSFALKDQDPESYSDVSKDFYNIYDEFVKSKFFGYHLMEMNKLIQKIFVPGEDDEIIKKYEQYADHNIVDIFAGIIREECDYSAILHGDCWSNNMMFKYENGANGRKLTDMRLLDWQLIKVGSPVCDLSYCLYSGASKKVFDNLNEYLKIYHDSFSSFLRELGSDPEKLFPFSVLKEHWKKYAKFGMIMSFGILRMKLTHKEDIIDLTDAIQADDFGAAFTNSRYNEEEFTERIRGLLWHMSKVDAL